MFFRWIQLHPAYSFECHLIKWDGNAENREQSRQRTKIECMKDLFIFSILALMLQTGCKKQDNAVPGADKKKVDLFLSSPAYKNYARSFPQHVEHIDADAARLNKIDDQYTSIHLPVIQDGKILAVMIGFPIDDNGNYDLIYQDNSKALDGTGNIYQFTSANEKLALIRLEGKALKSFEIVFSPTASAHKELVPGEEIDPEAELDESYCGFRCKMDKCYNATKAQFPGDAGCAMLDIFFGVCSSATVTTCLIKIATGKI